MQNPRTQTSSLKICNTIVFRYNCGDIHCYADLARLRGVKYLTWRDESKLTKHEDGSYHETPGPHLKHANYEFDGDEFLKIVKEGVAHVRKFEGSNPKHDEL